MSKIGMRKKKSDGALKRIMGENRKILTFVRKTKPDCIGSF